MFSRYSVKKPLTVVLAALMVVLLGVISFTKMRTDLLPEMDLPYVAVVTVYAGASPEKVETGVTKPLESALSTVSGVHTVTSISQENTSMVIFEFEYGTNMDRAVIDMNNKMGTATASMDDAVGTPILMQINPDMLPVMIASVDVEGKSSKDITPLVSETVVPAFERLNGVASVEAMGLIERQLKVSLSQQKIDALNDRILEAVDQKLAEAQEQLREGETALEEARAAFEKESAAKTEELTKAGLELEQGKNQLQQGLSTIAAGLLTAESSKELLQKETDALTALTEWSYDSIHDALYALAEARAGQSCWGRWANCSRKRRRSVSLRPSRPTPSWRGWTALPGTSADRWKSCLPSWTAPLKKPTRGSPRPKPGRRSCLPGSTRS